MAPGQTDFAKKLCEQQREQAKAIQNAFLAENRAGEFEAFRATRPHVPNPAQYVGAGFTRRFNDGYTYTGNVVDYNDRKQWWRIKYVEDDQEEDFNAKVCTFSPFNLALHLSFNFHFVSSL